MLHSQQQYIVLEQFHHFTSIYLIPKTITLFMFFIYEIHHFPPYA